MKFLIDAQLPPVLKFVFRAHGHDAIHSLDLPLKND
jgi:predicted nuclease of predicted toxin-antitoxin system